MPTLVDQLPLLAFVERHPAVWADPALTELGVDVFIGQCRGFAASEEVLDHCGDFVRVLFLAFYFPPSLTHTKSRVILDSTGTT